MLLQPFPILDKAWKDVYMNFIRGLQKQKRVTILVVVDWLTKYCHFMALQHPYTAKYVIGIFSKEMVQLHGYCRSIVSDVTILLANLRRNFRNTSITLKFSRAYHPQTDDQTEVVNISLQTYLHCFCA